MVAALDCVLALVAAFVLLPFGFKRAPRRLFWARVQTAEKDLAVTSTLKCSRLT